MELRTRAMHVNIRPDGIIETAVPKDWDQPDTVEVAMENIEVLKQAVGAERRAILSHVPTNIHMSKEVMACYEEANIGHVANALLTNSFTAKVMGNLFLKLSSALPGKQNAVPTKLFSKKADAEAWLLEQIGRVPSAQ